MPMAQRKTHSKPEGAIQICPQHRGMEAGTDEVNDHQDYVGRESLSYETMYCAAE